MPRDLLAASKGAFDRTSLVADSLSRVYNGIVPIRRGASANGITGETISDVDDRYNRFRLDIGVEIRLDASNRSHVSDAASSYTWDGGIWQHGEGREGRETKLDAREVEEDRENGEKVSSAGVVAGRPGGGKFNFDPVDSAVIPKFNL